MPESIAQASARQANHETGMKSPEEKFREEKLAAFRHLMNAFEAVEKKHGESQAEAAAEMLAEEVASW